MKKITNKKRKMVPNLFFPKNSCSVTLSGLQFFVPPVYAKEVSLGQPISGIGKYQEDAGNQTGTLLTEFLSSLITTLTVIGSIAFAMYFIIGGLKWITSSGDKTKAEEAKTQMTQAAIGLIVVVVSFFIIGIISNVLGLNILDPATVLNL